MSKLLRLGATGTVKLAGAITAIAAALYTVAPTLRRPEKLERRLDTVGIEQGVTLGEFRADTGLDASSKRSENEPGVVVDVHTALNGHQDSAFGISVRPLAADTLVLIPRAREGIASACEPQSPNVRENGVAYRCWLVAPPIGQSYFVRAQVHDGRKVRNQGTYEILPGDWELMDWLESSVVTSHHAPHHQED